MDTASIDYEYNIIKILHTTYHTPIVNEVRKLIGLLRELIVLNLNYRDTPIDQILAQISLMFFKNSRDPISKSLIIIDYGRFMSRSLSSLEELDDIIKTLSVREGMAILKSLAGSDGCFMYEILLEYKSEPKRFLEIYPFMNERHIIENIKRIEALLDFDIEETKVDDGGIPLYKQISIKNHATNNYLNLCQLWIPYATHNIHQSLLKNFVPNKLTDLITTYEKTKTATKPCTIFRDYPFVEPKSEREKAYLIEAGYSATEYPYNPAFCLLSPKAEPSLLSSVRRKYKKFSVAYSSGHAVFSLMIANYFTDVNPLLITLACVLWTVPYNHSINEVFSAAKQMDIFPEYDYKKTSLDNMRLLLVRSGLFVEGATAAAAAATAAKGGKVKVKAKKYTKKNKCRRT